jgi:uncharacterized circularly permuted ATP-grasp superfamily protein/uncharacterized alpha-E superfamily protein
MSAVDATAYRTTAGRFDEMVDADGRPREHWAHVQRALGELGVPELLRRDAEAARLLDQDGAVYNAYDDAPRPGQRWRLDAVPAVLGSREWQGIESALIERAEVLSLVLADLYGPRELLRRGLLPAEVVFEHEGFLRACDGVRLPGAQQLFSYAADLARDAAGNWTVLSDRAQAPSGFGYALENRTVTSRVLPSLYRDAGVHRLDPFFRTLRGALQEAAPAGVDDPRIVVLTPGPWNETAFEHAVLSAKLGYPLVEASDLVVRADGVRMRSLGRTEPVDVILRRIDGASCDPLELDASSQLGIPGLVEATRRGAVTVVNTLGSSVLENPALMRFLPGIARHLLGRDLELPCVPAWWCGDADERAHVLEHLGELVLRPISAAAGSASVFGERLSSDERDDLRRRIEARPGRWVAHAPLALSTVPTLTRDGLEPRRSVLRAFAVARGESYVVMPGALTRVAPDDAPGPVTGQAGALAKDTWVLASEPERVTRIELTGSPTVGLDPSAGLSPRAVENLWWLGRYAERAEGLTRLLRIVHDRRNEFAGTESDDGAAALATLLRALAELSDTAPADPHDPGGTLLALLALDRRPGTIAFAIRSLLEAAYAVRDQLSGETWVVIGDLDRRLLALQGRADVPAPEIQGALQRLTRGLLALSGITQESMVRDVGWHFLDGGRRVERAVQQLTLLHATLPDAQITPAGSHVLESVLTASESVITYRRRYRSDAQLATALELLLFDEDNPRSLAFGLARLGEDLAAFPRPAARRLGEDRRLVLEATTALRVADPEALLATGPDGGRDELRAFLGALLDRMLLVGAVVERDHFAHRLPQRTHAERGPR